MVQTILGVLIFCLILFFYLHVCFHLKTSCDLELYEIDQYSKEKMEEICDIRQPVLFDSYNDLNKIVSITTKDKLLQEYPSFEVNIRTQINNEDLTNVNDYELFTPMSLQSCNQLLDSHPNNFSESNGEFLKESGCVRHIQHYDSLLRPALVSNCDYDIMLGGANATTPLRYNLNYRNFFIVTQGSVIVKLSPPKNSKYLHPINDYENFEFRSQIDPWNPQQKYVTDFSKSKCIDVELTPGKFLFIPARWWHSFKFSKNSSMTCFYYRTYMNNIAICPSIFMYALQNQNVERKFLPVKTLPNSNDTANFNNTANFSKEIIADDDNKAIICDETTDSNKGIDFSEKIENSINGMTNID